MKGMREVKELVELRVRVAELEDRVRDQHLQLVDADRNLELLAKILCETEEFSDWLLEQDASSMEMYRSQVKGVKVEDQDDLTLALAFAGRAASRT